MAGDVTKKITIEIGSTYKGSGAAAAAADVEKLRKQLALPVQGPLTRDQAALEQAAQQRIAAMQKVAQRERAAAVASEADVRLGLTRFSPEMQRFRDQQAAQIRQWRRRNQELDAALVRGSIETDAEIRTRMLKGVRAADDEGEGGTAGEGRRGRQRGVFEQMEKFNRFLHLGGAIGAAEMVGRGLQRLPDAGEQFRQNLRVMGTRAAWGELLADTIPGAGSLGRGINAAFSALDDQMHPELARARDAKENHQKIIDESIEQAKRNEANYGAAVREGAKDARYRLAMAGTEGVDRQRAEMLDAFRREEDRIAQLRKTTEAHAPTDAQRHGLDLMDLANVAEYKDRVRELAATQLTEWRDAATALKVMRLTAAHETTEAERVDFIRNLEREVEAAKGAAERRAAEERAVEKLALYDRMKDEERAERISNLRADARQTVLRAGGYNVRADLERNEQGRIEALRNVTDPGERQAIIARYGAEAGSILTAAGLSRENVLAGFRKNLAERSDLVARRLRLGGQPDEADKLTARRDLASGLADIAAKEREEARVDPEHAAEAKDRAKERARLAREGFETTLAEIRQRQASRLQIDVSEAGGIAGDMGHAQGLMSPLMVEAMRNMHSDTGVAAQAQKGADEKDPQTDKLIEAITKLTKSIDDFDPADFFKIAPSL